MTKEKSLPAGVRAFRGKFQARLWKSGESIHLGTFDTEEEASRVVSENRIALGLNPHRKSIPLEAVEFYLFGNSLHSTAKQFGVSYGAIRAFLSRHNITLRGETETRRRIGQNIKAADLVGYKGHHRRVSVARGRPSHCEECGISGPGIRYEWASMTKNYADVNDYKRLCCSCHRTFDETIKNIIHMRDSR